MLKRTCEARLPTLAAPSLAGAGVFPVSPAACATASPLEKQHPEHQVQQYTGYSHDARSAYLITAGTYTCHPFFLTNHYSMLQRSACGRAVRLAKRGQSMLRLTSSVKALQRI